MEGLEVRRHPESPCVGGEVRVEGLEVRAKGMLIVNCSLLIVNCSFTD